MKKILFPFELDNPVYREAYIFGIKFARNVHAELIILNVFKVEVDDRITKHEYENLKKHNWFKAYNEICRFNKYYLEQHVNPEHDLKIKFSYRFVNGVLIDEVREIALREDIDMVVVPLSDQNVFNKRQLRIFRDNLYKSNRTSLLIVPFQCVFRQISNIVFAIDHKLKGCRQYLEEVVHLGKAFDSMIHFLFISARKLPAGWESTEEFMEIKRVLEKNGRHVLENLHGKNIVEQANAYVDKTGADLLIVVRHQNYFLETIFHDSIGDSVSFKSKVPVIVMREKK